MYKPLLPVIVLAATMSPTLAGVISSPPTNFLGAPSEDLIYDSTFLQSYLFTRDNLGCNGLASASVGKRDYTNDYAYNYMIDDHGGISDVAKSVQPPVRSRCSPAYVSKRENYDFGNIDGNSVAPGTNTDPWASINTPSFDLPNPDLGNGAAIPIGNTILAQGNGDFGNFNTPPGATSDATLGLPSIDAGSNYKLPPSNPQGELAALPQNIPCHPQDLHADPTLLQILGSVQSVKLNCHGELYFTVNGQ